MRRPEIVKPQEKQLIVVGNTMIIQLILQSYIFERNLNVVENIFLHIPECEGDTDCEGANKYCEDGSCYCEGGLTENEETGNCETPGETTHSGR